MREWQAPPEPPFHKVTESVRGWAVTATGDLSQHPVVVGEFGYPRRIALEAEREGQAGPRVVAWFEMVDGTPAAVDLRITADDGSRLRASDVAEWSQLESWALRVYRAMAMRRYPSGAFKAWGPTGDDWRAVTRDLDGALSKRRPPAPAELQDVANVYRDALARGDNPTEAVRVVCGYGSQRTAARRVEQARAAGLLPKTRQGKAKG